MTVEYHTQVVDQVNLRQQAIKILYKKFGNNKKIYDCADEWASKQSTTSGIVDYYKAYFSSK